MKNELSFETNLNVLPEKKATANELRLKYFGFPLGVIVFLALYFMPTPAGLTI